MSRTAAPARLILRKDRGRKVWVIKDHIGGKAVFKRTGCDEGALAAAQGKLERYLAESHQAPRRQRRLDEITLTDVIAIYAQDVVVHLATRVKAAGRLERLEEWWGGMKLDEVTGAACRQFAASRTPGAARRELQDLQAAINYHHREGYHRELVRITLPKAGLPRERWLTRNEVAHLLRLCLHTGGPDGGRGGKRPLRHLARFILFALYTGSRTGDCLQAAFRVGDQKGYVDTRSALYHRRPVGKRETKKRQPTTPIDGRLLVHLSRWERQGARHVVVYDGRPVRSIKTAWRRLIALSGLGADVIPYSMRATTATWMMQRGVSIWDCANYLGTSPAMIEKHYGKFAPEHLKSAASAVGRKR